MKKSIGIFLAAFILAAGIAAQAGAALQKPAATATAPAPSNACGTARQAYIASCQKGDRCSDQCTQARAAMTQCMWPNKQNKTPPILAECKPKRNDSTMPKDVKKAQPPQQ